VGLGVGCCTRVREGPPQPLSESKAIGLNVELETPFLLVRFSQVKMEVCGPRSIGHNVFHDDDVIGRS